MCDKRKVWFCLLFAFQMRGIKCFNKDWTDLRKKKVKIQETEGVRSQARSGDGVSSILTGQEGGLRDLVAEKWEHSHQLPSMRQSLPGEWDGGGKREGCGEKKAPRAHCGVRDRACLRQPGGVAWRRTPAGRVFFSAHPLPH